MELAAGGLITGPVMVGLALLLIPALIVALKRCGVIRGGAPAGSDASPLLSGSDSEALLGKASVPSPMLVSEVEALRGEVRAARERVARLRDARGGDYRMSLNG